MLKSKKDKNSKSPKGDDTAAKMKGKKGDFTENRRNGIRGVEGVKSTALGAF